MRQRRASSLIIPSSVQKKKTEYFARGVTRKSLWWQVCVLYDPAYVEQTLRLRYRHSYDHARLKPTKDVLDDDAAGKLIYPKVSYEAATKFFDRFDIKFNKLRVDTCEDCSKFAFRLGRGSLTEEQRAQTRLEWQRHLHEADTSCVLESSGLPVPGAVGCGSLVTRPCCVLRAGTLVANRTMSSGKPARQWLCATSILLGAFGAPSLPFSLPFSSEFYLSSTS